MLSLREAAEYCGVSAKRFSIEIAVRPIDMPGGQRLYDIRDLDQFLDNLKAGASESYEDIIGRLA
jgi:predicted HTH domain antitoxin